LLKTNLGEENLVEDDSEEGSSEQGSSEEVDKAALVRDRDGYGDFFFGVAKDAAIASR
jgi:hypothetical protein